MYKNDEGQFVVHLRHLLQAADGPPKLLKSAEVGFALAEYSNGDDVDPPTNITQSFCKEKPAKLLPSLANAASLPPPKPTNLPPLPLANAARRPLTKPQPLQNDAANEADAIKQTKYVRD